MSGSSGSKPPPPPGGRPAEEAHAPSCSAGGCQHHGNGQQHQQQQQMKQQQQVKQEQQQQQVKQEQHEEDDEELLEQQALGKIIFALRKYGEAMEAEIQRWEHNYRQLSPVHRALLAHLPAKAAATRAAAAQNQRFIKAVLMAFAGPESSRHEQQQQQQEDDDPGADGRMPDDLTAGALRAAAALEAAGTRCPPGDVEKVRYVLKNLVRDWSAEGAAERSQSYGPIVQELKQRFAGWQGAPPPRVLLPGAGLGRLCAELAASGFEAQGNEFSYYMLLAASFVLNTTVCAEQWTVHPWLHMTCNNVADADQLRGVGVPDVVPGELVPPGLLSMVAGDFAEVYARPEHAASFDAVVTCFFLDTAHNPLDYLAVIAHVLRPGGLWLHFGPLLWHWADAGRAELSVELSLEDVAQAAQLMGFDLLQQQQRVEAAYIANVRSMYKTVYDATFWTMRKSHERRLPDSLPELLQLLAARRQQQQQEKPGQPAGD